MTLAIASGKGGTGKTTLAVNLARIMGGEVRLLDCDVEEPNAHLFLQPAPLRQETVSIPVPAIDPARCDGCGECSRFCRFHAIVALTAKPMVFAEMCHGCGGCMRVCPRQAIREVEKPIGTIDLGRSGGITLVQGRLHVGVALVPPLIRAVKRQRRAGEAAIIDAPPGTSCPMVVAVRDADFVLLVTEPTPFGLNDLRLAVETVRELRLPFGVVVNRMGSGDERVHAYCDAGKIPVLLEIPDDRRIAEAYSRGEVIVEALPEYNRHFRELAREVTTRMKPKES